MPAPDAGGSDHLAREVLAEAGRRAADILSRARQSAESVLSRAAADAAERRDEYLNARRAEAARRTAAIRATIPLEIARLRAARVESILNTVRERALERLVSKTGFDYRASLTALAAEAVASMGDDACVIRLAPGDRAAFGDDILRRLARPAPAVRLEEDPAMTEPGVIVRDADGRRLWDNRLRVRLDRLWSELAREVAARVPPSNQGEPGAGP
jgi:vacuolar-type H+-ATPase subunit E/Vma4